MAVLEPGFTFYLTLPKPRGSLSSSRRIPFFQGLPFPHVSLLPVGPEGLYTIPKLVKVKVGGWYTQLSSDSPPPTTTITQTT